MSVENLPLLEKSRSLQTKSFATIFSAVGYGAVFTLAVNCYRMLAIKIYHNGPLKPRILRLYTTYMLLACTFSMIQTIYSFMKKLDNAIGYEYDTNFLSHGFTSPLALPFAVWGADGFMTWRCLILYRGISRPRFVALVFLLAFLGLVSFTSGVLLLITSTTFQMGTLFLIPTSIAENITLTSLIIGRIIHHLRQVDPMVKRMRIKFYTYATIMGLCIESCALIITFPLAWLIVIFSDGYIAQIAVSILPHICAIAALMLVCRVAEGRAISFEVNYSDADLDRAVEAGLRNLRDENFTSPIRISIATVELEERQRDHHEDYHYSGAQPESGPMISPMDFSPIRFADHNHELYSYDERQGHGERNHLTLSRSI